MDPCTAAIQDKLKCWESKEAILWDTVMGMVWRGQSEVSTWTNAFQIKTRRFNVCQLEFMSLTHTSIDAHSVEMSLPFRVEILSQQAVASTMHHLDFCLSGHCFQYMGQSYPIYSNAFWKYHLLRATKFLYIFSSSNLIHPQPCPPFWVFTTTSKIIAQTRKQESDSEMAMLLTK